MTVTIRPLRHDEVRQFWQLAFSDPNAEWAKWDGPYFEHQPPTETEFLATAGANWVNQPLRQMIVVDGQLVGAVTAYYEDGSLQRWLEVGIAIYRDDLWGQQIGKKALQQWLDYIFEYVDLPHVGFTTWSGNQRMVRLGDALGMKLEGRIRQVRFWQGQYFDSVKYGILRDEWQELREQR